MEKINKYFIIFSAVGLLSSFSCISSNTAKDPLPTEPKVDKNVNIVATDEIAETIPQKAIAPETLAVNTTPPIVKNKISIEKPKKIVAKKTYTEKKAKPGEIITHKIWHDLLTKYVDAAGNVDYNGLKQNETKIKAYTSYLKQNSPEENWPKNDKLAYWINLYNASTVQLILENYPLKSIRDIPTPWDKKFIDIKGTSHSLNDIENVIIRPQFKEPRIHFAVNCAAISCPKLLNEAFHPAILEQQLDNQTTFFVTNKSKNNLSENEVKISKIFEWYKEDFKEYPSIIDFLNKYTKVKIKPNAKVEYMEYNWMLNDMNN